jgi:DNA repair exonuclease SbcCD ATPase subunit
MTDKLAASEERARELYDCNKRLEEHVHDLESRKRAPLYQKKQEEELKAAVDKAVEAETRAQEAELKMKEVKVKLHQRQHLSCARFHRHYHWQAHAVCCQLIAC